MRTFIGAHVSFILPLHPTFLDASRAGKLALPALASFATRPRPLAPAARALHLLALPVPPVARADQRGRSLLLARLLLAPGEVSHSSPPLDLACSERAPVRDDVRADTLLARGAHALTVAAALQKASHGSLHHRGDALYARALRGALASVC